MSPVDVLIFDPKDPEPLRELLEDVAGDHDLRLTTARTEPEAAHAIGSAEVLISTNRFPMDLLESAASLRWIHVQGAGVNLWMDAPIPAGVRISRTTGTFGARMAEYALAYVFAIAVRVRETLDAQRDRRWQPLDLGSVRGATLGVAGLGEIGSGIARLARATGMRVTGLSRSGAPSDAAERVYASDDLEAFLAEPDYVVAVPPLTPQTTRMFGRDAFRAMKPEAWLINMGRGPLVDEDALLAALDAGELAGAVLDVFEREPLPPDHPFWKREDVFVTPHHAGTTLVGEVADAVRANLPRFFAETPLIDQVERDRGY